MDFIKSITVLMIFYQFTVAKEENCSEQASRHRRSVAPGLSTYHNAKLDDIVSFRIQHTESRNCLEADGQKVFMRTCDNSKLEQVWKMDTVKIQVGKLQNKKYGNCLSLQSKGSTELSLKACGEASNLLQWTCFFPKSTPNKSWKDMDWPGMASVGAVGKCVSVDKGNKITMKSCTDYTRNGEQNIRVFNRRFMGICAKAGKLGDQTTSADYYILNHPAFKLDWNVKYVEVYMVYSNPMYKGVKSKYGTQAMKKIDEHAQEIVSMLDKFYRKIKFRILLVGIQVFETRQEIDHGTTSQELHRNVGAYINELKKRKQFDIPIYLFEGNLYGAAGTASHNFCSSYWGPPFIITLAQGDNRFNPIASYHILTHEVAHLLHSPHNYDPPHTCPSYHLFGARCTLGGNDYPKGFSSGELAEIRQNRYNCLDNKPTQTLIYQCGNGIIDPGEECDCGSSQNCLNYDSCCEGSICKLKKGAECSNENCCSNCKTDINKKGCGGYVKKLTSPGTIKSDSTDVRNVLHRFHIKASSDKIVSASLHIPKFEFEEGCPYDYIEVKDGNNERAKSLGRFCRTLDKVELRSTSSDMFIIIKTDQSFRSEFVIMYSMVSKHQTVSPGVKFTMITGGSKCYEADQTGTSLQVSNACSDQFMFTTEKTIRHIKTGKCLQPQSGDNGIFYRRSTVLLKGDCMSSSSVFVITGKPGLFHPASGLCLTSSGNDAIVTYCDTTTEIVQLLQGNGPIQPANSDQYVIRHYGGRCLTLNKNSKYFTLDDQSCKDYFERTTLNTIRHISSGKCLAPESHQNNAFIIASSSCNSVDNVFKSTSEESLQHDITGKCIHPFNGYTYPQKDSKIVLYAGCSANKLRFNFKTVPLKEVSITHSSGLCLQVPAGSNKAIFSKDCTDKFMYKNTKVLIHKRTKQCLIAASTSDGAKMILTNDCSKAGAIYKHTAKGSIKQVSTGKCIHPYGGYANPAPGTEAVLWSGCDEARLSFSFV